MKMNCTTRNADITIRAINEVLETNENVAYCESLRQWKEEGWEKYQGQGFVRFGDEEIHEYSIDGSEHPEKIVVLTDNYCGSAGDIFVYLCKQSSKVTVIGRPTMGVNDYSNLTSKIWNHQFELMYATSRLDQLDTRQAQATSGIQPHVYIPWTPLHIENDVDLEKAITSFK